MNVVLYISVIQMIPYSITLWVKYEKFELNDTLDHGVFLVERLYLSCED